MREADRPDTAHADSFARDNLPLAVLRPERLPVPGAAYAERMNAVSELLDAWIERGHGAAPAFTSAESGETWSYAALFETVNRIANVLTTRFGLVSGARVMLRSANNPMFVACYLAVMKAGGIVVATMPLLRAKELRAIADKGQVSMIVSDARLVAEARETAAVCESVTTLLTFGGEGADDLGTHLGEASPAFEAAPTFAHDICLIGFTSGTTGQPKGTMHDHADVLAICDCYGAHVLKAKASDVFIGSPPLAFTFGLGGLVLFPMRVGASAVLLEKPAPDALLAAIRTHRPTVCFTAPTAYRALLGLAEPGDLASLATCVSAGEALPRATFDAWMEATGHPLMDGIGATEMLHIFISAPREAIRPGAVGLPVPGYEAKVIGEDGAELPDGETGRLAVRGPTGCRYLADSRQADYVQDGWNVTGDTFTRDADGYFWYRARSDDMIVSSGYNIAGPEVEEALMAHDAVAECGVVGAPDPERGHIVKAYIVLKDGWRGNDETTKALQDHVKAAIAPYKYPRAVAFVDGLPRTQTGKLQRHALRALASEDAGGDARGDAA
ncbi:MAG: AMP-binding protein [Pseudomonadota bacterium]